MNSPMKRRQIHATATSSHRPRIQVSSRATSETGYPLRLTVAVFGIALLAAVVLYEPALRSPFIFDDSQLPFYSWGRATPLSIWVSGMRPTLMFSYWLNRVLWGDNPAAYHAVNIAIHGINTGLVFLVLWRLLGW